MTRQKIVLAYSGGLDTSILVRILSDDYGYDVIACHADVGEAKDKEYLAMRARKAGAIACEVVDAQDEFARDFCFPALQANALYQGVYPLSAALSRPLIARHLVAAARKHGATAVAHGATGKGNDQVRFDLAVKGLAARTEHFPGRCPRVRQAAWHRGAGDEEEPLLDRRESLGPLDRGRRPRGPRYRAAGRGLRLDQGVEGSARRAGLPHHRLRAGPASEPRRQESAACPAHYPGRQGRRRQRRRTHRPDGGPRRRHQEPRDL